MATVTYLLPEHWTNAIYYGELDGMDWRDVEALEAFLRDEGLEGDTPLDIREFGFTWAHSVGRYGVLPADCVEVEYVAPGADMEVN
jgi:hypothetical protein